MMAEGTTSSVSISLKEVGKLFGQLFALLLAIFGVASVTTTSKETTLLMKALAFMVTLFYMVLVLATVLNLHLPFVMVTFLILGTVVTFIALMIIFPMVAWIYLGLWIFILALVILYYKYQREIYQMIQEKIKYLFERPSEIELGTV
ncbi:uncharacterized protein LOC131629583 [Vicia villosa]|uniref:uncharacterized protein LOC131629583 n=1 Tax=Vicia villosa TaxID=3911 RepID=UPI00273C9C85|nr:uncharacterized protein LOC131629583 [Vicia villosa]